MNPELKHTIELLATLISYDTTSRNSNLLLIDYIEGYLQSHGVECTRIWNEDKSKANLLATIGPATEKGVVLSGHTDVVPVDGQDWVTPPFTLTEKEGLLYGRGTADMKSFIAVALAMVPSFLAAPLKKPVHLAFSYDEEVGCLGVHSLVEVLGAKGITPMLAVIGEPTEMRIINTHKGIYSYQTTVTGMEAHSSAVHKGVSAIMVACELVYFLKQLQEEYKHRAPSEVSCCFDPPYTSFHVGTIHGGTAQNIIPGNCVFQWEFRTIPGEDVAHIMHRFERKCEELQQNMRNISPFTSIETIMTSYVPDLLAEKNSDAEQLLLAITGHNAIEAVAFGTEAGIFQKSGIPALICGPGSIAEAHKPNEFIAVTQIEQAIHFMKALIAKFLV
jgi:acetylornithine deacetylase